MIPTIKGVFWGEPALDPGALRTKTSFPCRRGTLATPLSLLPHGPAAACAESSWKIDVHTTKTTPVLMCVCASVYQIICVQAYMYIYLSIYLSIHLSIYPSVYLSVFIYWSFIFNSFIYLFIYVFIYLLVYVLCMYVCVYAFIYSFMCVCIPDHTYICVCDYIHIIYRFQCRQPFDA